MQYNFAVYELVNKSKVKLIAIHGNLKALGVISSRLNSCIKRKWN